MREPHNKEGFGSTKAGPEGALFIKTKEKERETALNAPYESLTPYGAGRSVQSANSLVVKREYK